MCNCQRLILGFNTFLPAGYKIEVRNPQVSPAACPCARAVSLCVCVSYVCVCVRARVRVYVSGVCRQTFMSEHALASGSHLRPRPIPFARALFSHAIPPSR